MTKITGRLWSRGSSFRRQLTLVFSTGVIAAALISALISSWSGSQSARENFVRQGRQITENLAKQSPLALLYASAENARDAVQATLAFPDVRHVAIYALGNRLLVEGGVKQQQPANAPSLQAKADALLESDGTTQWTFVAPVYSGEQGEEMSPFETVKRNPELLGYVRVSLAKDSLHLMMRNIFVSNMLTSLSLAALLLLVLRAVTSRITRPLSNLAQIMRRAEQGELKVRAAMEGPRDITDMAHAFNEMMSVLEAREAELRKNRDDAIEGARIKGQFTANVGHEIRTPMNGVLGMLDLLREMQLTRKQREYVEIARNSGQLLLTLLNDLLDFSKLEVGKLNLENVRFDLRNTLEDALELLAEAAHRKPLELAYFIAADVPHFVYGDPTRLRQILTNLVSNAIKFTNEGEVTVYVRWESEAAGSALRFEIKDTGIGIDAKAQKTVFDSYSQADGWTTRKYGGTGLGLTISRQLVTMMGGEIGVISQPGRGSTFWFTLRLRADPNADDKPPVFPGLRALVIERVECSRMFLGEALTSFGMEVDYASSLTEVRTLLEAPRAEPFEFLVVNDALGGADIVRAVRSYSGYEETPAVLMGRMQTAIHSADAEGIVWTAKPVRRRRLLESISEAKGTRSTNAPTEPSLIAGVIPAYVLIVEDNLTNQLVASGMLNRLGCRIDLAQNGREGVEAVARTCYDIVLMDCNMPEMDGYEATTRIRGLSSNKDTIVIAMTANVHPGEVEKCLSVGMNDYLSKPLGLEELREKIVKWMASPSQGRLEQARASYATFPEPVATLDIDRFAQLRKLFGKTMADFVAIYLEEVPAAIIKLKEASAQTHGKQIVDAAHSIKGTSINLGLAQLATIAKEIEQLARGGELGAVSAALSQLDEAFERAQETLKLELERMNANADS